MITYHTPQVRYASLAEMHGTPSRRYPAARRCLAPGCGARLSVFNPGPVCFACQKSRQVRERLRASASSGDAVAAETASAPAPRRQRPPGQPLRPARGTDGVMRANVLAMLTAGRIVSGADIGRALGLSRSVVSKHIGNLRREGHVIDVFAGRAGSYRRAK